MQWPCIFPLVTTTPPPPPPPESNIGVMTYNSWPLADKTYGNSSALPQAFVLHCKKHKCTMRIELLLLYERLGR